MKTFYTVGKKNESNKNVYLQESGDFASSLDSVKLYMSESDVRPLQSKEEFITRIFQPEPDKIFE